jgi:hypothetical protein
MKKLLLVVLIVILLFGVSLAEAKVEFGSWDKWDESLPTWDNKGWQERYSIFVSYPLLSGSLIMVWTNEDWITVKTGRSLMAGGKDTLFLLTHFSFVDKKAEASIILFSPATLFYSGKIDNPIKHISIADTLAAAEFALVVFPPKKGEVVVRAYEKSGSFLEEWITPFKNNSVIFPEKTTEFTKKYESWMNEQGIEEKKYHVLPRLIINNEKKKEFLIGVALEVFEKNEVKATIIF